MKRLIDPVILCARARAFPDPRVGSCEFPRFPRNIRETRSSDQIESRSKGRRCQKKVVDACRRIENYWPRYVSGFYQSLPLHRARSCSLSLSFSLVLWETNFSAAFCQNARIERMISRGDLQSKSAYGRHCVACKRGAFECIVFIGDAREIFFAGRHIYIAS
jgi:hypothetical protein